MNKADNQHLRDATIPTDGGSFVGATFERCTLVYSGGVTPDVSGARFMQTRWKFDGAASETLMTLALIEAMSPKISESLLEEGRERFREKFKPIARN